MKKHYFDYAASTPVDKKVLRAMLPYFSEKFGNAGSLHSFGQGAIAAVDKARETIAEELGAEFRQIIFTGSATEANSLAIKGVFFTAKKYFAENGIKGKPKIIVSSIEHESVLESARALMELGAEVVFLPVDKNGFVREDILKKNLDERTVLVSIMLGNNEIGTIQPIEKFAKIISEFRAEGNKVSSTIHYSLSTIHYPLLHTDASQALQYLDCNVNKLGVDLMTISSQKIYGPKGAGALYIRELSKSSSPRSSGSGAGKLKAIISPIISGGNQEFGLRSGTENVPAIVGFAEAVKIASKMRAKEAKRVAELKAYFLRETKKAVRHVFINGETNKALPHVINIYLEAARAEEILTRLDLADFAVSTGSACRSRSAEPSHVILALGFSEERARGSLRVSFGRGTKKSDILKLVKELKKYAK